ncbi:MAG: hypothetical protein ACF8QF_06195 [Phycisphaerales bacterium]
MLTRRLALLSLVAPLSAAPLAQSAAGQSSGQYGERQADPRSVTLAHMLKPVTVELADARLEDVIRFIEDASGADLEPVWIDEHPSGLDPDAEVSIAVRNVEFLTLLERVLDRVDDEFDAATWQMAPDGLMEVGPRSALNQRTQTHIYDVNDLLYALPSFREVPDLDLGAIQEGGGGGGQTTQIETEEGERVPRSVRIQDLSNLIQEYIEPDQWVDNGGDAASITEWNGTFIVRAPDYIHRQISGYAFWPSERLINSVGGASR